MMQVPLVVWAARLTVYFLLQGGLLLVAYAFYGFGTNPESFPIGLQLDPISRLSAFCLGSAWYLCRLFSPKPCNDIHTRFRSLLHGTRRSRHLHELSFRNASRSIGEPIPLVTCALGLAHWSLWAMARPISNLIERAAAHCGKLVGLYSHFLVNPSYAQIIIEKPLSQTPVVWIGWHECNLLALAFHERILNCAAIAFVPPGLNGAAMRGWLEALHVTPIPIRRGMALRQVRLALAAGADVLIAVDGPGGHVTALPQAPCGWLGLQEPR